MKILFIGKKASGKSTLLYSLFKNYRCGGIVCLPVFKNGKEIGKDAVNLMNNERRRFCRIKEEADFKGIKVGRYLIDPKGIKFCIDALNEAMEKSDLIIFDEFGKLEMEGRGLYEVAEKIIEGDKNAIIVLREELEKEFMKKFPHEFKKIYIGKG